MYQEPEMSQENPTKGAGACLYVLYCTYLISLCARVGLGMDIKSIVSISKFVESIL